MKKTTFPYPPLDQLPQVTITGLSHEGRGIAHLDGRVVWVEGALPQETVHVRTLKKNARSREGVAQGPVIHPHPDRVTPPCPQFGVCGGCSLQHWNHPAQVRFKQDTVLEQLAHFGRVQPECVAPPLMANPPWHYRHRARLGVKYMSAKEGDPLLRVGFREKKSRFLHTIWDCQILHPRLMDVFEALYTCLSELSNIAQIPQLEVLVSDGDVALCIRHLAPFSPADLDRLRRFEDQTQIRWFLQAHGPDSIQALADPAPQLFYTIDEGAIQIPFGPTDFTQVHFAMNRLMVAQAMDWLAPAPGDQIGDLFCGLGNFTLPMARRGAHVEGIEGDLRMVETARAHAQRYPWGDRIRYAQADLLGLAPADPAPQAIQPGRWNKILLDPPRTGAQAVLAAWGPIWRQRPAERILYVSCHPATLARDVGYLVHQAGWILERVGIVDMFPHTAHVETMALLRPAGAPPLFPSPAG